MPTLDAIFLPEVEPDLMLGLELELLESARSAHALSTLIVHSSPHRSIALGRYHLYESPGPTDGAQLYRRLTGGRAAGAGPGWIWIALVAPGVDPYAADDARPIGPEQVINRNVRGLLGALRTMGIDCSYPGRDAITSNWRELAMCAFECDRSGAMLFEAALAIEHGMMEFVGALDSAGSAVRDVTCPLYDSESATTLAREMGRDPGFDEVARMIAGGYAALAGDLHMRELSSRERAEATRRGGELCESGWLRRAPAPSCNRFGRIASQLGSIQAHLEVRPDMTIANALLTGELIANSSGVVALERSLDGLQFEQDAIEAAVSLHFADQINFVLGMGAPAQCARTLARMIAQAQ